MKIYREARSDLGEQWFDTERRRSFQRGSGAFKRMEAEVAAGKAEILPYEPKTVTEKRRSAYQSERLTANDWLEALVEQVATMPTPHQSKFAALLAKRQAIRDRIK